MPITSSEHIQTPMTSEALMTALTHAIHSDIPATELIRQLLAKIPRPFHDIHQVLAALAANPAQAEAFEMIMKHKDSSIDDALQHQRVIHQLVSNLLSSLEKQVRIDYINYDNPLQKAFLTPFIAINNRLIDGCNRPSHNHLAARYYQYNDLIPLGIQIPNFSLRAGQRSTLSLCLFLNATQHLCKRVPSINIQDINGRTALHHLMLNAPAKMKALLYSILRDRDNPLFNVAHIVSRAIEYHYDHNDAIKTLNKLLDDGANIHILDYRGNSPLHAAAAYQEATVIHRLIQAGPEMNEQNRYGMTPLLLACSCNQPAAVAMLLSHQADASIGDKNNNPAQSYIHANDNLSNEDRDNMFEMIHNAINAITRNIVNTVNASVGL